MVAACASHAAYQSPGKSHPAACSKPATAANPIRPQTPAQPGDRAWGATARLMAGQSRCAEMSVAMVARHIQEPNSEEPNHAVAAAIGPWVLLLSTLRRRG